MHREWANGAVICRWVSVSWWKFSGWLLRVAAVNDKVWQNDRNRGWNRWRERAKEYLLLKTIWSRNILATALDHHRGIYITTISIMAIVISIVIIVIIHKGIICHVSNSSYDMIPWTDSGQITPLYYTSVFISVHMVEFVCAFLLTLNYFLNYTWLFVCCSSTTTLFMLMKRKDRERNALESCREG